MRRSDVALAQRRGSVDWLMIAAVVLTAPVLSAAQDRDEAGISAQLRLATDQPADVFPYRMAVLEVNSRLSRPVAAVSLRAEEGGPTLLLPLIVPPGGRGWLTVALPAVSPTQNYLVMVYDRYDAVSIEVNAVELGSAVAGIDWPLELVTGEYIINPAAFEPLASERPVWDRSLRENALAIMAGLVVLSGAVLGISRASLRLAAVVVLLIGATGGLLLLWRHASPPLVNVRDMAIVTRGPAGTTTETILTVLGARRTAAGQLEAVGAWPTYGSRASMARDITLLRPMEPGLSGGAPVSYVIAPSQQKMLVERRVARDSSQLPPQATLTATGVERLWGLQVSSATPAGILLRGDRFISLPPVAAIAPMIVSLDDLQPLWRLRADARAYGFDSASLHLLNWWDQVQRDVNVWHLVYAVRRDGQTALVVSAVRERE